MSTQDTSEIRPTQRRDSTSQDLTVSPQFLKPIFENIPGELKAKKIWAVWKGVPKQNTDGSIRYSKPPRQPSGEFAKSNDPATWASFDDAKTAYDTGKFDGLGIMTVEPYITYDQDHCVEDGQGLNETAKEDLDDLNTYCEISPSGHGIRAICKGKKPGTDCKRGNFELYDSLRFITVTGHTIDDYPSYIRESPEGIKTVYDRRLKNSQEEKEGGEKEKPTAGPTDDQILEQAKSAKNGSRFEALYKGGKCGHPSMSEGDLAFCDILAYYTKDSEQIKRIWRNSGRHRPEKSSDSYLDRTIEKALTQVKDKYPWGQQTEPVSGVSIERSIVTGGEGKKKLKKALIAEKVIDRCNLYLREEENGKFAVYRDGHFIIDNIAKNHIDREIDLILTEESREEGEDLVELLTSSAVHDIKHHIGAKAPRIRNEDWDKDDYLFCAGNCTVNLRTGEMLPHSPDHRIRNFTRVNYDPEADTELWEKTLRIAIHDPSEREYFQKMIGYGLTGGTWEQCCFFLVGREHTGKSTIMTAIRETLGNYATPAPRELLLETKSSGNRSETAVLHHATMVIQKELSEEDKLDKTRFKEWTGERTISDRDLYESYSEKRQRSKLYIPTNELPSIRDPDGATMRRIRIFRFRHRIPADLKDAQLADKLTLQQEGILRWCVEGAVKYAAERLETPQWMKEEISAYYKKNDPLVGFKPECLVEDEKAKLQYSKAVEAVREHGRSIDAAGIWTLDNKEIDQALRRQLGGTTKNSKGVMCFNGYRLKTKEERDMDD